MSQAYKRAQSSRINYAPLQEIRKKQQQQTWNTITTQAYQPRCSSWKPSNKARIAWDFQPSYLRDRAEGGAGGALAPPRFCKNKDKLNKK